MPSVRPIRGWIRWRVACLALILAGADRPDGSPGSAAPPARAGFAGFDLPDAWEERFWAQPGVRSLLTQEPKALAAMVPTQAGLRFCRCPSCTADEVDDPLAWSPEQPESLTCRRCGAQFPNDKVPAKVLVKDPLTKKDEPKVPEEEVDVLPGVVHRYPYHGVEPARQRYPDERIYLDAKRDYEAREFLAKAALYAAVRSAEQPAAAKDPALARLAGVLLLRFAQVYPAYATHYDQPGQPKFFQTADLPPPYRLGYRTAKWDWSGALDVPVNLVIAYALIRDDPALAEAGRQLGDPHPGRTIERDLFRASAEFVRLQPETTDETSLYADRGLLAAGLLLGDPALVREARARLDAFSRRSFYHDGLWRQADAPAHRRVLGLVDGWIDGLLALAGEENATGADLASMLALARSAAGASLIDPRAPEVHPASWPASAPREAPRRPILLGGAGLARLAVGAGDEALDLELRGFGSLGGPRSDRLALRLAVGGRPALGDLDDRPPSPGGFERSTASHNAVAVDGLNQRETPVLARQPAPGADILFFAADPDFQVATFDDRQAFPRSTSRYRQTVVAASGPGACYAVSLFEVRGGLQHDQLFHAPPGAAARWRTPLPLEPGPLSLLPDSVTFLPSARAEDGRWFLQSFGAFSGLAQGRADRPFLAWLEGPGAPPLRVHVLGDGPLMLITGASPDPSAPSLSGADEPGRAALVLRRRSADGSSLATTFVTVFEARGPRPGILRVGRLESPPGTVVLLLETAAGTEHLVVNFTPGTRQTVRLSSGDPLETDGLAVRETADGLVLAGGTFAETTGRAVRQSRVEGTIRRAVRAVEGDARGWFEAATALPEPEALAGRALLIRHGDGTTRGWTIARAENTPDGRARLLVREEPGFQLDPDGRAAVYYQFPGTTVPGPHRFRVARIAR